MLRKILAERAAAAAALWDQQRGEMEAVNPNGNYINAAAINGDKYTGASNVLATIHRNQWNDWQERFKPKTEQLANYAQSGELTHQGIGLAANAVDQNFSNMAATQNRQQRSLGINMTDAQKKSNDRIMGLTQASTKASAMNQARISGEDRDMGILAGGSGLSSDLTNMQG